MKKKCPYIEKRTIQKAIIKYNEDLIETGSMVIIEREMAECDGSCMRYKDGECTYGE